MKKIISMAPLTKPWREHEITDPSMLNQPEHI